MKKFTLGFVLGAMLFSFTTIFANEELRIIGNPFPIFVNGVKQDIPAYNINSYTYMKLADIGKILDAKVIFNETDSQIEITKTRSDNVGEIIQDNNNRSPIVIIPNSPKIPEKVEEVVEEEKMEEVIILSEPSKDYYTIKEDEQQSEPPKQPLSTTVQFDQSDEGLKIVQYKDEKLVEVESIRKKIRKFYTDGSYVLCFRMIWLDYKMSVIEKLEMFCINKDFLYSTTPLDVVVINVQEHSKYVKSKYVKYDDYKNIILPEIKIKNDENNKEEN